MTEGIRNKGDLFLFLWNQGRLYPNEPRANKSVSIQVPRIQHICTSIFTEASNTCVIATAHKQVCANQKVDSKQLMNS